MTSDVRLNHCLKIPESVHYESLKDLSLLLSDEKARFTEATAMPFEELSETNVDDIRLRFSGRKSPLQEFLKSLKNLPAEERKGAGAFVNELKSFIEKTLLQFLDGHKISTENKKIRAEKDDITLPLPEISIGARHPISAAVNDLLAPLKRMGFTVVDGPEIDKEFFNFEALNIPATHPSREMQDTFFLSPGWVMRTQTSNVQSHAMIERKLPLKIVCPGFVYRNEFDLTHVPSFRQIECLVVDKGIHMGHLKHTLNAFFNEIFGRPVRMRFRSSYFPFTEPSAEIDVECPQCRGSGCRSCKHSGWLEMGGCGLVHRSVFVQCGIDPDIYSGFAFGMGVDRISMIKHAISDLRALFDGDIRFLRELRT